MQDYWQTEGDRKLPEKSGLSFGGPKLLRPEKSQVISNETLKEEYCSWKWTQKFCEMMIAGVKDIFGEQASYQRFHEEESEQYNFNVPGNCPIWCRQNRLSKSMKAGNIADFYLPGRLFSICSLGGNIPNQKS